jgi:adenine/guanine/hypoxanthine permease
VLPTAAIVPILLYIGLLIGAQAFQATPRAHAAAVVAALIPNIASWAAGQMDNALAAAGTSAAAVGEDALNNAGVVYGGLNTLGQGAVLAGMVLGALVVFLIDKKFIGATVVAVVGAVLSFIGLIHAPELGWNMNGTVALGYLFVALICAAFAATRPAPRVPDAEELELDRLHGGGAAVLPVEEPAATVIPAADVIPAPRAVPADERVEPAAPADEKVTATEK